MLGLRRQNKPRRLPLLAIGFGIGGTAYAAGAIFRVPFAPMEGQPAPILCPAWEMNCTMGDLPQGLPLDTEEHICLRVWLAVCFS